MTPEIIRQADDANFRR